MAYIYAKSPNGTTQSINIDTMNITGSLVSNGWTKLPNGLIIQWIFSWISKCINCSRPSIRQVYGKVHVMKLISSCTKGLHEMVKSDMNSMNFGSKSDINRPILEVI